jgi:hypothetical protein
MEAKGDAPMANPTYRVKKTVPPDKTVTLTELPFAPGDQIEIVVIRRTAHTPDTPYPLRGQPIHDERPFDSVAEPDGDDLR